MARIPVALSSNKEPRKYVGSIKLPGQQPFEFDTKAKSPSQAKNNGLMQFARKLNMSIGNLHRQLKLTTPTITVMVNEEDH